MSDQIKMHCLQRPGFDRPLPPSWQNAGFIIAGMRLTAAKPRTLLRFTLAERRSQSRPTSGLQPRNQADCVAALDRLHLLRTETHLPQARDLTKREIRVVGAVGDLRCRYELEQRRHRRRTRRVRGVVMQPLEFADNALRKELPEIGARSVE